MARHDLSEFLEDGSETFDGVKSPTHPDGKSYTFASPSFAVGVHLTALFEFALKTRVGVEIGAEDAQRLVLSDDQEQDLYRQVMGATYDELMADKVPWTSVQALFGLLFAKHAASRDIGETLAGQGNQPARANRATRRAATAKKPGRKKSPRQAKATGDSATPTPAPASIDSSHSSTLPQEQAEAV